MGLLINILIIILILSLLGVPMAFPAYKDSTWIILVIILLLFLVR